MSSLTLRDPRLALALTVLLVGCKEEPEPEPEPQEQPELAKGEACDPEVERIPEDELAEAEAENEGEELPAVCAPGLACDPTEDGSGHVCGTALEIRGRVSDSVSGDPIEGALVTALNETGEPVANVVATDSCGDYVLGISVRRTPDGEFAETPKWTLGVSASDYLPFPTGARPALPVDIAEAVPDPDPPEEEEEEAEANEAEEDGEDEDVVYLADVIDTAATHIALIPLPEDERGGATVSGTVGGEGSAGTLVVAEGGSGRVPYGIADSSGAYTVFNVQPGDVIMRGYRRDLELEAVTLTVDADEHTDVDLPLVTEARDELATVDGSLNIVNADGGLTTSVVLVPVSVYNDVLERGPVPIGLRVPEPPEVPNVSSGFQFTGVPSGTYKVLVAFENDMLVRDPDEGIAGTEIQEITVAPGQGTTVEESFKVTEALEIVGPGRDAPEDVDAMPTFEFADDSSEDGYIVTVFDALGELVWESEIPGVSGQDTVRVAYEGPALTIGMYYQFRVVSFRDPPNGERTYISRTEDLRGVFFHGEAAPVEDCEVEEDEQAEGGEDEQSTDTEG